MALENEDGVANALDALSPSEVMNSQRLLSSFRGFFARGSARDFCELLPDSSAERSRYSSPRNTSSKGREYIGSPAKKAKSSSSQQSPHGNPSTDIESSRIERAIDTNFEVQEAWNFLVTQASSEAQVHRLMKVLEGVLEAPKQTEIFYRRLWSAYKTQIFGCHESSKSRIVRLFQGRKVIDQEAQRFECAGRFSLVFLTHDVEVIKAQDWKLAPGQSRQHAAVMSISKQLNVEPDEIKKEWRRSRNYVKLLEEFGPASLLELGTGVNWYWEKALTKQDVLLFIRFFREKLPSLEARIKEFNQVAGEMILDGMLAYGWTKEAICQTETRLRNALRRHCPGIFGVSLSISSGDLAGDVSDEEIVDFQEGLPLAEEELLDSLFGPLPFEADLNIPNFLGNEWNTDVSHSPVASFLENDGRFQNNSADLK